MMRSLRHVNIDHLHVGWYQSTYYGSFVTRALLDSQFSYQHAIEESVVLIYGSCSASSITAPLSFLPPLLPPPRCQYDCCYFCLQSSLPIRAALAGLSQVNTNSVSAAASAAAAKSRQSFLLSVYFSCYQSPDVYVLECRSSCFIFIPPSPPHPSWKGLVELDQMSSQVLLARASGSVRDWPILMQFARSSLSLALLPPLCIWQKCTKPGLFRSTKIFFFSADFFFEMAFPQALQTRCSVLYQNCRQFNSFIAFPSRTLTGLPYLAGSHIVSSWEVNVTSRVSVRKNTNEYDQSYKLPQNGFSMLTIGLQ